MLDSGCTQHMAGESCMFKSIDTNQNGGFDSITFGNNKKGKVKGLGKIAISNDMNWYATTSRFARIKRRHLLNATCTSIILYSFIL